MKYSAPGKLFISGEWSILEVGNRGLVAAVNNRVHVSINESEHFSASAQEFGVKDVRFDFKEGKTHFHSDEKTRGTLKLLGEAIGTSLNFLSGHGIHNKPFHISTSSKDTQFEVNGLMKKVGFGSSAAVVVATVAGVLDFHGYKATKEEIYKLATIAHFYAQGKVGSAFDVAASTYGGVFVYSRFDPNWLTKKIESGESLGIIVKEKWPSLVVEEIVVPDDFNLLVGWTGESASTTNAVKQMNEYKSVHKEKYYNLMNSIAKIASHAIDSFKKNEREKFLELLRKNEELLRELGNETGVNIETPELRKLSDIANDYDGAGKLSGAGGGDCGIAVCFDEITANNIISAWSDEGLIPLEVTIDRDGVRKD